MKPPWDAIRIFTPGTDFWRNDFRYCGRVVAPCRRRARSRARCAGSGGRGSKRTRGRSPASAAGAAARASSPESIPTRSRPASHSGGFIFHPWQRPEKSPANLFVAVEEVGNGAGGEDAVEVLEEGLLFDVVVADDEGGALALDAARAVEDLQVLQEVGHVVRPRQRDVERLPTNSNRIIDDVLQLSLVPTTWTCFLRIPD